jgi:NADH:ubiquinone oxidoreductase subunit 6 (subunit J)
MKALIAVAFVGIIGALVLAGVFMMRGNREGQPKNRAMARALAVRVALSILLFAFILLSYWMGWIHPTGIPVGR